MRANETLPEIRLKVLSGPDVGAQKVFRQVRITIGRGPTNDFPLQDGFVSNFHGEVTLTQTQQLAYRDLRSRHGSLVCVDNVSYHLHSKSDDNHIQINDGSELQIGTTLIRIEMEPVSLSGDGLVPMPARASGELSISGSMRETMITSTVQPVQQLTRPFETTDKRLGVLFRLAGQLNGLTQLEEILDQLVAAAFEAFSAANFFALTLMSSEPGHELELGETLILRHRDPHLEPDGSLLSKSILQRVIQTRESVLFVKDSLGAELTQSIIDAQITACLCAPLVGQRSLLGVMQVDTRGEGSLFSRRDLDLFSILASLAAFALERAKLSSNIVEMFERFVYASVDAIEARDPTTAGHSHRVAVYTLALAETANRVEVGDLAAINLDPEALTELRYAALLHDFGKIAVREDVLNKARRLPELHLELIAQRFETIKALAYRDLLEQPVERAVAEGRAITGRELEQIKHTYQTTLHELDEALTWLDSVAGVGWLPDEAVAKLRALGKRTYRTVCGHTKPYLSDYEIENLCIRAGTLNESEWENMRSHAKFSQEYLERIPWSPELSRVPCIAGAHHEKLDGSGYPLGLEAMHILPQVRMLTIADIFDALTASDRPYRKAATIDRAVSILEDEARQGKLDQGLVSLFATQVIEQIKPHMPSR